MRKKQTYSMLDYQTPLEKTNQNKGLEGYWGYFIWVGLRSLIEKMMFD